MGIDSLFSYGPIIMSSPALGGGRFISGDGLKVGLVVAMATVLAVVPRPAHAYLDPASGSLFLQLLLGGFAGAALLLKLYWRKIRGFFSRQQHPDEPAD